MIEPASIELAPEVVTAEIALVIPRFEIPTAMGPAIREIYSTLASQGITPTGPWFTHHRNRPTEVFDFTACVPVATPVKADGRVRSGRRQATRVARTLYHGPYEGLAGAWGEFSAWIAGEGLFLRQDLWECYLVGPESSPDPSNWRTELNQPLLDRTH